MVDFKETIIVVTGAGGNLGKVVVEAFLRQGGTVFGVYHRSPSDDEIEALQKLAGTLYLMDGVDLTDRDAVIALSEKIFERGSNVGVVINTVGGFTMGERVDELQLTTWQKMYALNVQTILNTAAAFVPGMIHQGRGKFITIGSKASLSGGAKMGAYAAAKSAVLRLTESMAAELKNHQIQANCIIPGTIDTPENRQAVPEADFSNWVQPEEIAKVILFLSSVKADSISGASIPVYGKA